MAQILKNGRTDNRGGSRAKTSTKKMFTFRVETRHIETLKEVAIFLNSKKNDLIFNPECFRYKGGL